MFRRKTLFIVGAGASYELNLPTGENLKTAIGSLLNITFPDGWNQKTGDHQIVDLLMSAAREAGQDSWNYLLHKCWLIRDALPGALSIDNLLDAHAADQDLVYCGKLAIARALLAAERNSILFSRNPDRQQTVFQKVAGTWLIPFFQVLTESIRRENISNIFDNLTIITFNYDRCIEVFLPEALSTYYGIDLREAQECASRATIIHPYGQAGALNPQVREFHAPFGADRYDLKAIANGIRTFSEGCADESLSEEMEKACGAAEQIVFLGFAFHPANMQLLATQRSSAASKIFGTTLGLSDAAKRVVRTTILETFKKSDPAAPRSSIKADRDLEEINLESLDAYKFLESHFRGIA